MFLESGRNRENLNQLLQHRNQQVIINWYEDEMLYKRDGFFFTELLHKSKQLVFMKGCVELLSLLLPDEIEVSSDFRNFYKLSETSTKVIQIYFPY
ncbi:hypothetical protein [Fredinandcohnia sp. 179-A 10B2 NHS]|uniref:hypothetical protein n=1 Tax=Fredinandcohnia sp. 179-A 10B2 NHS TaxID=3235176 RepID=UPI0039A3AF78